jgi:hypothetical protein
MEEAEPRGEEGDHRGGFVDPGRERHRGAGLVVVLQEVGELVLVIQTRVEKLANRAGALIAEAVVQAFIVGIIKPLLLERPLHVPVDFGHETEAGDLLADAAGRLGLEGASGEAPRALEDLGHDEHGHVAADAVALAGDPEKLADHGFLSGGVAVVQLQRVGPSGEIGVAAVGEKEVAP